MPAVKHYIAVLVAAWLLSACQPANLAVLEDQMWESITVHVESRPMPVTAGMNEFWVVLTDARGRPMFDVMVTMHVEPRGQPNQAIQDGHTGVYRRALRVSNPQTDVLVLELKRQDKTGVLRFPLAKIAAG